MTTAHVQIGEASAIPDARRAAARCAEGLGFDAHDAARVALYATELATNLVKHGGGGDLLVQPAHGASEPSVDLLALDTGPGIADPAQSLRRGVSTTGTAGLGLTAVRAAAIAFDMYTRPGAGTVVFARIPRANAPPEPPQAGLRYAGISVPYPGQPRSGDAWAARRHGACLDLFVADGLGHGAAAADAAASAVERFRQRNGLTPERLVEDVHGALRHTRGAAVLVASLDPAARRVTHCGLGNVSGLILRDDRTRHLISHSGIAGHEMRRLRELTSDWAADALLVLHSDGLRSRWQPDAWPGLWVRHPAVIAGVLFRDLRRLRDDATVVVAGADHPHPESR
ncbi:MAG TPA: SpoIIE family protein phosphatase [Vicinamibacterales bacterium]